MAGRQHVRDDAGVADFSGEAFLLCSITRVQALLKFTPRRCDVADVFLGFPFTSCCSVLES